MISSNYFHADLLAIGIRLRDATSDLLAVESILREGGADGKARALRIGGAKLDHSNNGAALESFAVFALCTRLGILAENKKGIKWIWSFPRRSPASSLYDCFRGQSLGWLVPLLRSEENARRLVDTTIKSTSDRGFFKIGWPLEHQISIQVYYDSDGPTTDEAKEISLTTRNFNELQVLAVLIDWLTRYSVKDPSRWNRPEVKVWFADAVEKVERDLSHRKIEAPQYIKDGPPIIRSWLQKLKENKKWTHVTTFLGEAFEISKIIEEPVLEVESLETTELERHGGNLHRTRTWKRIDVKSLLSPNTHSVIIGQPGCGKSTFAKWICRHESNGLGDGTIKMCILLREYATIFRSNPNLSLLEFFVIYNCGNGDASKDVRDLIGYFKSRDARGIIVLDGWEEVPEDLRAQISIQISMIRSDFSTLVTCRPSVALSLITEETDNICKIKPLSGSSIVALVERLCLAVGVKNRCEEILRRLEADHRLQILGSNPYILTMLCQVMIIDQAPILYEISKSNIIHRTIDLIVSHQNSRNGHMAVRESDLNSLQKIAFEMSFRELEKKFTCRDARLEEALGSDKSLSIVNQSRLLTRNSYILGEISFIHPQFQEFLAARCLAQMSESTLSDMLDLFGISNDREEEWNFLFSITKSGSKQGEILVKWWRERLKTVDLIGSLYCRCANYLSNWKYRDGGLDSLGVDLRVKLWELIDSGINIDSCVRALANLDKESLLDGLLKRKENRSRSYIDLELVSQQLMSFEELKRCDLLSTLSNQWTIERMNSINFIRMFPPVDIARARIDIRDRSKEKSSRIEALISLYGYRDEDSLGDVLAILHDPIVFDPQKGCREFVAQGILSAIINLPDEIHVSLIFETYLMASAREDAVLKRRRKNRIERRRRYGIRFELDKEGVCADDYFYRLQQDLSWLLVDGASPAAEHILPRLIDLLKDERIGSRLGKRLVNIISYCQSGDELSPILVLIKSAPNFKRAIYLFKVFRRCESRELMVIVNEYIRNITDRGVRLKAWLFVLNRASLEGVDVAWLISMVKIGMGDEKFSRRVFCVLAGCRISPSQQVDYDNIFIERLKSAVVKGNGYRGSIKGYNAKYYYGFPCGIMNISSNAKRVIKKSLFDCLFENVSNNQVPFDVVRAIEACINVIDRNDFFGYVKRCENLADDSNFGVAISSVHYMMFDKFFADALSLIQEGNSWIRIKFICWVRERSSRGGDLVFDDDLREELLKSRPTFR